MTILRKKLLPGLAFPAGMVIDRSFVSEARAADAPMHALDSHGSWGQLWTFGRCNPFIHAHAH